MNKRSDNRLFFNLTAVIVFLLTILLSCIDVFAAKPVVRAYDETDMEISFNEDNYALNAGNVTFVLDRDALLPGQIYVYEDGGVITSVNDYTYVMEAGEDGEIKFVNFYIKQGSELKSVGESPYFVEFADSLKFLPDVTVHEAVDGRGPSVTVGTRPWVQTYLCIDDGTKKTERHITGKTDVEFKEDGEYRVSVYTMDGLGNRTYSNKLPESFIVDRKPPVITELETDRDSVDEKGIIFDKKVTLSAKAWDERSKVEEICWIAAGQEAKAGSLVINPPFKGNVEVYAIDSAGNRSEKVEYFSELVVDDEEPVLKVSQKTGENGILKLEIGAADKLSGTEKIVTKLDGKVISEKKGSKDVVSIDLDDDGYEEKRVVILAFDRAGNRAEGSVTIKKSDTTAPVIDILGVTDRSIYGNDVEIMIDAKDDSGCIPDLSSQIFVRDAGGKMIYSQTTDSRKLWITQSGIVTLTVTATDEEKNRAVSTVSFIIDKDAPLISGVEKYDGKVFEDFILDEEPQDMIEDLSCVTYDVYLNGLEYDGREVEKSGNYVLKIAATDEFGRRSEQKAEFSIIKDEDDKAAPQALSNSSAQKTKPVSKNTISSNTASQNRLKKTKVQKKAVSADRAVSKNTVSQPKTVSSAAAPQEPEPARKGFFESFYYGILKLLGKSH
ncbi:MAG: hypothetical protein J5829_09910 [Lachnospiraceae bacterium]|nr:hypothetical protein [Lachnospiraceae bacterium]